MQYAILIDPTGGEKLVTITEMQRLGEDKAREFDYVCPDEYCRRPVHPSFPEKDKPGRDKAPRPYFSARPKGSARSKGSGRPKGHDKYCRRDGTIVAADKLARRVKIRTFTPEVQALLADYPQLFDETEHRDTQQKADEMDNSLAPPAADKGEKIRGRSSGQSSPRSRESVRGSRHIRKFVRVYESLPELRRRLPIRIRFCKARNYEQAFRDVGKAVDSNGHPAGRSIYHGRYYSHHLTDSGGIVIYFRGFSGNSMPLGVWVPEGLGPQPLRNEIKTRLDRAGKETSDNQTARIYILGEFQLYENRKYSVDITKLGQLWVSFPDDNSQQP